MIHNSFCCRSCCESILQQAMADPGKCWGHKEREDRANKILKLASRPKLLEKGLRALSHTLAYSAVVTQPASACGATTNKGPESHVK